MTRRTLSAVNPNQGILVTHLPQTGVEVVADLYSPLALEDGPAVDILERSKYLGSALTALSNASRLSGLQIAADTPGLRGALERRYDDVDALAGRSYDARQGHLQSARENFAKASGHYVMLGLEPENEAAVKARSRADFDAFSKIFADSKGAASRRAMQKKLQKQQRIMTRSRDNRRAG